MKNLILRGFSALAVMVAMGNLRGQNAARDPSIEDFHLEGVAIWQCQCPAYACPCQKNGLPVHDTCYASDFAHIQRGRYGKVSLDGLNLVLVGNLVGAKPDRLFGTLYIDKAATPQQSDALTHLFNYLNRAANDPPVPLRQIKVVPITFQESSDHTPIRPRPGWRRAPPSQSRAPPQSVEVSDTVPSCFALLRPKEASLQPARGQCSVMLIDVVC